VYLERGWATRTVARESLHDLFFNPGEGRNAIDEPDYAPVAAQRLQLATASPSMLGYEHDWSALLSWNGLPQSN